MMRIQFFSFQINKDNNNNINNNNNNNKRSVIMGDGVEEKETCDDVGW